MLGLVMDFIWLYLRLLSADMYIILIKRGESLNENVIEE